MARHWWVPGAVVLGGLGGGALAAGRVVSPLAGFIVFALSGAVGLIFGAACGGVTLYRVIRRRDGARRALATAAIPLLAGLAVLASFLSTPGAIYNDVTTNLADPPIFVAGPAAGIPYPDDFRAWHRDTYPYLAPVRLSIAAETVLARAEALAVANGWSITAADPGRGLIQALARTSVFRFEDDVVIRVRGSTTEAVVDMRSRSRVGRGDRGVNARRIQDFLQALRAVRAQP